MRVVREQMLCIISPGWNGDPALLAAAHLEDLLSPLLKDVGVVHFASLALLPPMPGSKAGALPSLMLEINVDEGTRPLDLLSRLVYHPGGALLQLYGGYVPWAPGMTAGQRNELLLEKLMADLSIADGGFVGPRDRTVAQIQQERELYIAARQQAPRIPAGLKDERTSFAAEMVRWALTEARFPWAAQTAPRSFWRGRSGIRKISYFGAMIGLVFGGLWLAGLVAGGLKALWSRYCGGLPMPVCAFVRDALQNVQTLFTYAVDAGWRLAEVVVIAAVAVAAAGLLFFVLGPAVRPLRKWSAAVVRELNRPTDAWAARAADLFCWLVAAALAAEVVAALAYVLVNTNLLQTAWVELRSGRARWLHALLLSYAVLFCTLLLVLALGLRTASTSLPRPGDGFFRRQAKTFRRWFHRPSESDIPRAQQVHASIEHCEAKLVGGTAHMISLTELRWPFALSVVLTRLSLRVVTAFGYVFFTEGRLGDAPGIQYSHWHIIDGGRRLLFCANFDGTFGGYLDDFIKGASTGTTLFWRWTHLLPRPAAADAHPGVERARAFAPTRLVVFRGVKCELKFKTYARESMLPHLYRFDASGFTVEQKNRATAFRDALSGQRTDPKDDLIMRAIES